MMLPHLGKNYGIGGGDSPLMMTTSILKPNQRTTPACEVWTDAQSFRHLPDNIDLSTVELRYLPHADSVTWEFLDGVDTYTVSPDFEQVDVTMTKDGVILLVGVLPTPDVTAVGVEWTQLTGGQPTELDGNRRFGQPYVGGWNLYRIAGISGTTVFPETAGGINENIWEELTLDSLTASVPLDTAIWIDPAPLETGICASYAIIPIDREGNANLLHANITRVDGAAAQVCGDAIPPSTTLEGLSHTWRFTNDEACFEQQQDWSLCYEATMTWTWPAHEAQGEVTWNVYRGKPPQTTSTSDSSNLWSAA